MSKCAGTVVVNLDTIENGVVKVLDGIAQYTEGLGEAVRDFTVQVRVPPAIMLAFVRLGQAQEKMAKAIEAKRDWLTVVPMLSTLKQDPAPESDDADDSF